MLDNKTRKQLFSEIRIIVYCVIVLSGILSCTIPFRYLCDFDGYSCPLCGMRHAIDYVLKFDFISAYKSNPLIVLVVLSGVWMITDCIAITLKQIKTEKTSKTAE